MNEPASRSNRRQLIRIERGRSASVRGRCTANTPSRYSTSMLPALWQDIRTTVHTWRKGPRRASRSGGDGEMSRDAGAAGCGEDEAAEPADDQHRGRRDRRSIARERGATAPGPVDRHGRRISDDWLQLMRTLDRCCVLWTQLRSGERSSARLGHGVASLRSDPRPESVPPDTRDWRGDNRPTAQADDSDWLVCGFSRGCTISTSPRGEAEERSEEPAPSLSKGPRKEAPSGRTQSGQRPAGLPCGRRE